jgi:Dynein light chain type 1
MPGRLRVFADAARYNSLFTPAFHMVQAAAQLIKNTMDKKFGASWHCAIGEGFGFEITYQKRNMIYMYYGQLGVLAYKC